MENLCRGVVRQDRGSIHAVWLLWQHHAQEEDWEFLLIDMKIPSMRRTALP